MHRRGYYSPVLRRDLVTRLYFTAKDLRIPMTLLADRIVEDALNRITTKPAAPSIQILPQPGTNEPAASIAA